MKTNFLWECSLGFCLAALPLTGCGQRASNSAPAIAATQTVVAPSPAPGAPLALVSAEAAPTGMPDSPEPAEQNLENAPAQIVSTPQAPANTLSAPAREILKLAQAGVEENVMMAYVTNSAFVFNLASADIVYLNDVGVPASVVVAMIQRDQTVRAGLPGAAAAGTPPVYTNQLVPAPGAPTPYATSPEPEPQTTPVAEAAPVQQPVNVSYAYFYESLAPYGTWIDIAGYGRCWQPSVVVVNRGWQPYCDRGRWVYSDCGWYWASDYSWGWAPFHYGRWFCHYQMGWCWAPDTLWGPSWVSWRYTSDYCGWAPLPPSACYRPGIGFTYYGRGVGVDFHFGLTPRHYAFVPVRNFHDRHPSRYRLPERTVTPFYSRTVVAHQYDRDDQDRIINRGIPVDQVRTATRTDIRPVTIRQTDRPAPARFERGDGDQSRTLTVYRPNLPQPEGRTRLVGEGVRPAPARSGLSRGERGDSPAMQSTTAPLSATPWGARPVQTQGRDNTVSRDRQNSHPIRDQGQPAMSAKSVVPAPIRNEAVAAPVPAEAKPIPGTHTVPSPGLSGNGRPGTTGSATDRTPPPVRTSPHRVDSTPAPRSVQPAAPQPAAPVVSSPVPSVSVPSRQAPAMPTRSFQPQTRPVPAAPVQNRVEPPGSFPSRPRPCASNRSANSRLRPFRHPG